MVWTPSLTNFLGRFFVRATKGAIVAAKLGIVLLTKFNPTLISIA